MNHTLRSEKLVAAGVHSFTSLGVVLGFMALRSILHSDPSGALLWLGVAMVVDGLDGPMARHFRISEKLPHVDGAVLDKVIDYLTYALIPAIFLYYFELIPAGWGIAAAAVVLMTSLYSFANRELKTRDNFFDGFPATWNLVILGFYLLGSGPVLNGVVVVLCGVLTFFPVKFIHPFRVKSMRPVTIVMTIMWALVTVHLITRRGAGTDLFQEEPAALLFFSIVSCYFIVLSIIRSVRGRL